VDQKVVFQSEGEREKKGKGKQVLYACFSYSGLVINGKKGEGKREEREGSNSP